MKIRFCIILFIILFPLLLFSKSNNEKNEKIIIDFGEFSYSNVLLSSNDLLAFGATKAIIKNPLNNKFDISYIIETGAFYSDSYRELINIFSSQNIETYSRINLFYINRDFDRSFWEADDFIPDNTLYEGKLLIDITNKDAKKKLDALVKMLSKTGISKWIIDIDTIPVSMKKPYKDYIEANKSLIASGEKGKELKKDNIDTGTYFELLTNVFISSKPMLTSVTNYRKLDTDKYIYIPLAKNYIDSLSIYSFLLSKEARLVIPYSYIKGYAKTIYDTVSSGDKYNIDIAGRRMMIYSKDVLVIANYSEDFGMYNIKNILSFKNGVYKDLTGSSFIIATNNNAEAFLFPNTLTVWKF